VYAINVKGHPPIAGAVLAVLAWPGG